jgi:hypothetical protein
MDVAWLLGTVAGAAAVFVGAARWLGAPELTSVTRALLHRKRC